MSDWRPIETAPKDGTILLLTDGRDVVAGLWDAADPKYRWCFLDSPPALNGMPDNRHGPTHWTPLPDPPTGDSDDQ